MQAGGDYKSIHVFVGDYKALAMAIADHERSRPYLTLNQTPILWYLTRGTVAEQTRTLVREVIPHSHLWLGHTNIHVLWMPSHNTPQRTNFRVDTLEILDAAIKVNEYGIYHNLHIKLGLVKSWLPLGESFTREALQVECLNLAIEVLGYYYLHTRVVDLSRLTTRKSKDHHNRVNIQGHDQEVYITTEYRFNGGYIINYHTARRAREILRQVFANYKVLPDWELAITSTELYYRIEEPAITIFGSKRNLMDPPPKENLLYITNQRAAVRVRFATLKAERTHLPKFAIFPWEEVNITSAREGYGKQWSSSRHRLREENQVEETTAKRADLKDQDFWKTSRDHVIRLSNLGMTPRKLSDSPTRSLTIPPPRARSPPREQELHEEPNLQETEERGEIENLEITIRQTRTPAGSRRSALERIHPPRSRSISAERADRHRDRSRSRTKPKPAAGPAASSRRSRRSSPSPEYRNPSPPSPAPAPAPGATSLPSPS
jgi:hypothetical protein